MIKFTTSIFGVRCNQRNQPQFLMIKKHQQKQFYPFTLSIVTFFFAFDHWTALLYGWIDGLINLQQVIYLYCTWVAVCESYLCTWLIDILFSFVASCTRFAGFHWIGRHGTSSFCFRCSRTRFPHLPSWWLLRVGFWEGTVFSIYSSFVSVLVWQKCILRHMAFSMLYYSVLLGIYCQKHRCWFHFFGSDKWLKAPCLSLKKIQIKNK